MILEQLIESLSDIPPEIRGTLSEDFLSFVARRTIDSHRANEQGVPSVIGETGSVRTWIRWSYESRVRPC